MKNKKIHNTLVVQDLIVDTEYQQRGIGTFLFKTILQKYLQVRMFMLVTDKDDIIDNKFYQSFNMKKLEDKNMIGSVK